MGNSDESYVHGPLGHWAIKKDVRNNLLGHTQLWYTCAL